MALRRSIVLALSATQAAADGAIETCPGAIDIAGYGNASIVAAEWNTPSVSAAPVHAWGGSVVPEMWGRAYLADDCTSGEFNHTEYLALPLLGRRLTYTTDLSQAGCGCNGALYLVSMQQNPKESGCFDYYCDANSVCDVRCVEIDIQEANRYAWHSTLHTAEDGVGVSAGYGGGAVGISAEDYGPGGRCVDTSRPFQVSVAFPVNATGWLSGMEVTLSQVGTPCTAGVLLGSYSEDPEFEVLTRALAEGMTPVMSYWKSTDMLWLDGRGPNGDGPCEEDTALCGAAPQFYNFRVDDL